MKIRKLIPLIIFAGVLILFFFPNPQTNFIAYSLTALFFIILAIFILIYSKRK
ncbi:MAG: hypothetical protein U9Q06_03850 [Nanoarchaeota archaeon]|nr:hypothetical protein [Nanoarchaeota archaeon]